MGKNSNIRCVPYYNDLLQLLAQAYFILLKVDEDLALKIKEVIETCDSTLLYQ